MDAKGRDGKWHPWDELTQEEQDEWMEAMTEADRIHDYYKTHERPLTLRESMLEYEAKQRFMY